MIRNIVKILIAISFLFTTGNASDIDVNKLLHQAKENSKKILIFVHSPNCSYCRRMVSQNFQDKNILNILKNHFILLDIDIREEGTVVYKEFRGDKKAFADHIGAVAVPATLFMDQKSEVVYSFIGYKNIDEFLIELKYVTSKSYKKVSIEEFSENLEFKKDE